MELIEDAVSRRLKQAQSDYQETGKNQSLGVVRPSSCSLRIIPML
jgi:hypothetical protein